MATSNRVLRRRLVAYALGLGYVVTLAFGIVMVSADRQLNSETVRSAIGLNLIASAVFAAIFASLGTRIQERIAQDNIEELFQDLSNELVRRLADENSSYMPSVSYQESQSFGAEINRDIMESFARSSFCGYRGPSARYLAARIKTAVRCPQQVAVCMLNPRLDKAIARAASDTRARPNQQGKPIEVLARELQHQIVLSTVSLFDCRLITPIDISYMEDTMINRVEVFDDSVYMSWYHAGAAYTYNFPPCLRFPVGSLLYQSERLDLTRRWEVSDTSVRFTYRSTDQDLMDHISTLTGRSVSPAQIEGLRNEYAEFTADFVEFLRRL